MGEPAAGVEGFGGDNARTSIFDYWSMPEHTKWVNGGKYDGGRLNDSHRELRVWYRNLLAAIRNPAFTAGEFYGLNHANKTNAEYGRIDGESASGHWLYSFLRFDRKSDEACLVVANFHGCQALKRVKIILPDDAWNSLGRDKHSGARYAEQIEKLVTLTSTNGNLIIPEVPPCSAMIFEIRALR